MDLSITSYLGSLTRLQSRLTILLIGHLHNTSLILDKIVWHMITIYIIFAPAITKKWPRSITE